MTFSDEIPVKRKGAAHVGRTRAALISLVGTYAGSALAIVKGIIFVPLYLKLLGTDLYGAWLASGNVVGVLGLLDAGISHAVYQRLGEQWGAGDYQRFARTAGAAGAVLAGLVAILVAAGGALAPFVPRLLNAPVASWHSLSLAFWLATCASGGSILLNNLIAVSAAWQRSELGAATRIAGQLAETLTIGLGLWLGWGVLALGIGAVIGAAVSLGVGAVWTSVHWRRLQLTRLTPGWLDLKEIAQATLPLMVGRIVLQIDGNIEVALVSIFMNPAAAAIYGITDRVLRLASSFVNPIAGSSVSGLAHLVGERGRSDAIRPARELIAVWSLVITATFPPLLAINRDFTVLWVGRGNYGGFGLNVALFSSELLGAREWLFSVLLLSSGAVATSAWIGTVECLVRMPLMYAGLRAFGWIGLPVAQALVSLGSLVVYARSVAREYLVGPRGSISLLVQGFGPLVLSFLLAVAETRWLPAASTWVTLILKGMALGAVHLSLAIALAPTGRRIFARRLMTALPSGLRR